MRISLIQKITLGFSIIIVLVIAISGSAYLSQIKMSEQLELTASTLTGLLDKSNSLLLDLQDANLSMMQHANTQPPEKRKKLREDYLLSKNAYLSLFVSLKEDLKNYPALLHSLNNADIVAGELFKNAQLHLDIHDSRLTAKQKSLSESGNLNDTWDFFSEDFEYISQIAQAKGLSATVDNINTAVNQSFKALRVLQRSLALVTSESAIRFQKELLQYHAIFKDKVQEIMITMPDSAADIQYYNDELNRAIELPLGIFQQQLTFLKYNDQSRIVLEDTAQKMNEISLELHKISNGIRTLSGNALVAAEKNSNTSMVLIVVLAFVSVVIALSIAISVVQAIRRPLADIIKALNRLADGDLTANIDVKYHSEMGMVVNNINLLMKKQGALIYKVQSAASTINIVASESLTMSEQTNLDVSAQGRQADIVSTAVTELEATVYEVASHASNTSDEVLKVTQQAEMNMANMNLNLEFINTLKSSLDNASRVIQKLSTESLHIGVVLNVIQGIAEQTNLLALNAAIEAARAGEQGRGFAVVADEVRTLATRTQQSATEISNMTISLQQQATEAVSIVESNLKYADRSVNQTIATSVSLQEMLDSLTRINDMSRSIATASEEQSIVVKEVAKNIVNISDMANNIALGATKAAKNSVSLNELSNEQNLLVAQFKLNKSHKML